MRLPTIGGDASRIDEDRAIPLLRDAIDHGVNYVDSAYPYHGGNSERFLSRALASGYRQRVHLATKLPVWLVKEPSDWERLLDEQLEKLGTDTIDFYMFHALSAERWELVTKLGGLAAMERFRADGRIRHLGFSFHGSLSAFKTIVDGHDWEYCQIQLNFVDVRFQAGLEGLEYAAARGIGTIVMEPLRGGALAGNVPQPVNEIWARSRSGRSPAAWALGWVLHHPSVVTALSGMNAADQLARNLAIVEGAHPGLMGPEDLALVEEVRAYYATRTSVPCTTCGYCQPCPQGVSIPDVFSSYNTSSMFDPGQGSFVYRMYFMNQGKGADRCVACGECEPRCPQQIRIVEKLAEAHERLTGQNRPK